MRLVSLSHAVEGLRVTIWFRRSKFLSDCWRWDEADSFSSSSSLVLVYADTFSSSCEPWPDIFWLNLSVVFDSTSIVSCLLLAANWERRAGAFLTVRPYTDFPSCCAA